MSKDDLAFWIGLRNAVPIAILFWWGVYLVAC